MKSNRKTIGVVPIGAVPKLVPNTIAGHITGFLNLPVEICPPLEHPAYAYNAHRLQYDAGRIIESLESGPLRQYEKVLGVLDLDLFIPLFTHCLGQARQGGRCALVSVFRLQDDRRKSDTAPSPLSLARAAKIALHELGHLFALFHCSDHHCLMHFCADIEDLDSTPPHYCRYCHRFLQDALSRYDTEPHGQVY